jgi:hypothetical protein
VIHRVHSLLWRFLGEEGWRPGKCLKGSRDTDIRKLVLAEILHSLEKRSGPGSDNQTRAENATAAIWDMLLVTMTSNEKSPRETQDISTDGLRLAVFLAGGGNEEEHQ